MDALALLLDRQAVSDVVIQYATGIDLRRWDVYRDCFTDPVEIDFSSFSGTPAATMPADEWVHRVRSLQDGWDGTQHISSNHVVTLDGDAATCRSYMQAQHVYEGENTTLGGWYTNELVRTPEGWRIRRCQLDVTWRQGDPGLYAKAAARAASRRG